MICILTFIIVDKYFFGWIYAEHEARRNFHNLNAWVEKQDKKNYECFQSKKLIFLTQPWESFILLCGFVMFEIFWIMSSSKKHLKK